MGRRCTFDKTQILPLLRTGLTLTEIAHRLGVDRGVVVGKRLYASTPPDQHKELRALVVQNLGAARKRTAQVLRDRAAPALSNATTLRRMYFDEGLSQAQIANTLHVSRKCVEKAFKRHAIRALRGPRAVGWRTINHTRSVHRQNWEGAVRIVRARDRVCRCCGASENLSVHHLVPWVICATHHPAYLILVCACCHNVLEQRLGAVMKRYGVPDGYVFGSNEPLPEPVQTMLRSANERVQFTISCLDAQTQPLVPSDVTIKPLNPVESQPAAAETQYVDLVSVRLQLFDWVRAVRACD